jgi:hypothetical protein
LSLFGDWLMHAPPHLLFDHLELCPHAVASGFPFDLEFALAGLAADEAAPRLVGELALEDAVASDGYIPSRRSLARVHARLREATTVGRS